MNFIFINHYGNLAAPLSPSLSAPGSY
uniref:60S ribosomal protein L34 n=1 Tax=Arundo donax TaxID=35708 RepID=A0A0A9H5H3_ARUDO